MEVVELEVCSLEDVLSLSHDTVGSPLIESGLEAVLLADVSLTWGSSRYEGTYQRDAT